MVLMDPVGRSTLTNDDDQRTWLTENGAVLSAVAADDGAWELWQWVMVSRTEIAALPWGTGLHRRRGRPDVDRRLLSSERLAEGEQVDARHAATSRDRARARSRAGRRPGGRRAIVASDDSAIPVAPSSRARSSHSRARAVPAPVPWAAGSTASIRNSPSSSRPISRHGEPGGQ